MTDLVTQHVEYMKKNPTYSIQYLHVDDDGSGAFAEVNFGNREGVIVKNMYKHHLISVVVDPDDFDISSHAFSEDKDLGGYRVEAERFPMTQDEINDAIDEVTLAAIKIIDAEFRQ